MSPQLRGSTYGKSTRLLTEIEDGSIPSLAVVDLRHGLYAHNDAIIEEMLVSNLYRVLKDGRIQTKQGWGGKALSKWQIKKPYTAKGYPCIKYNGKHLLVHRIVYRAVYGSIDSSLLVNHKDRDASNYNPNNLEQVTNQVNQQHSWRVKNSLRRKQQHNKKLDMATVHAIRSDYRHGLSYSGLSDKYKISKSNVGHIVNKRTWA